MEKRTARGAKEKAACGYWQAAAGGSGIGSVLDREYKAIPCMDTRTTG